MNVVDIAKDLIRFKTVSPPGNEEPCARYIHDLLTDRGVASDIHVFEPSRANLVARIGPQGKPGLLMSGHMDVVPEGDSTKWILPPFEPEIRKGKLYGRGSADMKGADAGMLYATAKMANKNFKRQLTLVFTAGEEEESGFVGLKWLLDQAKIGLADGIYGVVGEPTGLKIANAHKGRLAFRIQFSGKSAHASTPELGRNAIQSAVRFMLRLRRLEQTLNSTTHSVLGRNTITTTIAQGGVAHNVIPDQCSLTVDCRLVPPLTTEKLVTKIHAIVKEEERKDKSFRAEIHVLKIVDALAPSANKGIVRRLRTRLGASVTTMPYATEASLYTRAGIPTALFGPGRIEQAHKPNEFVALRDLQTSASSYESIIKDICL